MTEVVSVKFKSRGKLYYFDPAGVEVETGARVVVETASGLELGDCVCGNHGVEEDKITPPLRPVVRVATPEDLEIMESNKAKETEAFAICQKKIEEHRLDMKLVGVEYNFEGSKILFFFTSDGRVDFRELVKALAMVFRTRIELRQIGVRDEAKMVGGLGICGRAFCCKQFLDDFQPVSTKMAKTQSMSLNPTKISGSCGRLMCCLRYEQEAYEELISRSPKSGAFVETPDGFGCVSQVSLLRQKIKVSIDGMDESVQKIYNLSDIAIVPGGRPKNGELPVRTLKPAPPIRLEQEINPVSSETEPDTNQPVRFEQRQEAEKENRRKMPRRRPRGGGIRPADEQIDFREQSGRETAKPGQKKTAKAAKAAPKPVIKKPEDQGGPQIPEKKRDFYRRPRGKTAKPKDPLTEKQKEK